MTDYCPPIDDDILKFIQSNTQTNEKNINKHGEVYTPISLACEMLHKIPAKVWNNPNLKWLEPSCGTGVFMQVAYYKLMECLSDKFPRKSDRSRHIIENMLFMCDIQKTNTDACKHIFGEIDRDAKLNIWTGDFLESDDMAKYDVIVGNPPYNSGSIHAKTTDKKSHRKREGEESHKTIWHLFVKKSLNLLNTSSGLLLFIHPVSWFRFKGKNGALFSDKQLLYIRYYNLQQSHFMFKSSGRIPVAYYLLQNITPTKPTVIYDNAIQKPRSFNIAKYSFIPTESVDLWNRLITFSEKYGTLGEMFEKVVLPPSSQLSEKNAGEYKFPIVRYAYKEIRVRYSKVNKNESGKHKKEEKLIFVNESMGYPIYDSDGTLYPPNDNYILRSSSEGEKKTRELRQWQHYFYTNLLLYLISTMKLRQNFFNDKIFEVIPNIAKMTRIQKITDEVIIRLFGLKEEELKGYRRFLLSGEGKISEVEKMRLMGLSKSDILANSGKTKRAKSSQPERKTMKHRNSSDL